MKVLKAYPIDGKFHYDVRSIHSWGLPRRGAPENRLKGNAAGFSAFGSLEIFKNRAMCSIGVICVCMGFYSNSIIFNRVFAGRARECALIVIRHSGERSEILHAQQHSHVIGM